LLATVSDDVHCFGIVGPDPAGQALLELLGADDILTEGVSVSNGYVTRIREWICEEGRPRVRLDVDPGEINHSALAPHFDIDTIAAPGSYDMLVVSDFAKECLLSDRPDALRRGGMAVVSTKRADVGRFDWCDLLIVSQSDFGRAGLAGLYDLACHLRESLHGHILVTAGSEGAGWLAPTGEWVRMRGAPLAEINPVGAGDTLLAATAWHLSNGRAIGDAIHAGLTAARESVTQPGIGALSLRAYDIEDSKVL